MSFFPIAQEALNTANNSGLLNRLLWLVFPEYMTRSHANEEHKNVLINRIRRNESDSNEFSNINDKPHKKNESP